MSKTASVIDVVTRARQFITDRHTLRTVRRILLKRTAKKDGVWLLEGEVWEKRFLFFTVRKFFNLQISVEAGEITSYEEKKMPLLISGWVLDHLFIHSMVSLEFLQNLPCLDPIQTQHKPEQ